MLDDLKETPWATADKRWEALRAAAKSPDIGKRIDDTRALIEGKNLKHKSILDKRCARTQGARCGIGSADSSEAERAEI
jgi:hypothetical protein